jgi:hypothetical protein
LEGNFGRRVSTSGLELSEERIDGRSLLGVAGPMESSVEEGEKMSFGCDVGVEESLELGSFGIGGRVNGWGAGEFGAIREFARRLSRVLP